MIIKDALLILSATATLIFSSFACADQESFTLTCNPAANKLGYCKPSPKSHMIFQKKFAECTFPKNVSFYKVTQLRKGVKISILPHGGQTISNIQPNDRIEIAPNNKLNNKNPTHSNQYTFTCKTRPRV